MGGVCLPVPFFSTVVISAATLEQSSASDLKTKLLPRITAGELVCSYAVTEPGNTYGLENIQTKAVPDGDGFSVNGSKLFVEYARSADYLLTVVREGKDLLILMVDSSAPGIEIEPYDTLDYADQCEVRFNQVKVPVSSVIARGGEATTLLKNLEERSAAGKCAEILGGIQVVLDMSVDYVKDREQFGQVVGSFQAVQHHCTNMVVEVDSSRYITMQAIWRIAQGLPATKEVAMAKSYTSAAAIRVTKLGHQTHGAISFCDELDMHLYLRKAHAASVAFGDEEYHLEKVANELGL
jgi:alkylation response protein AidB-like acyl-CoA dehydrogenase